MLFSDNWSILDYIMLLYITEIIIFTIGCAFWYADYYYNIPDYPKLRLMKETIRGCVVWVNYGNILSYNIFT